MTDGQVVAVEQLGAALEGFRAALEACLQVGIQPADALRACGIHVPLFAGPMVDQAMESMLAAAASDDPPNG